MALPNNDIATTTHSEQFLSPRDRVFTRFTNWERGGIGLFNATSGIDVYDWYYRVDRDTGQVYASVPGVVAEQLVYTISPLPKEFMGSFDTNMRPLLVWRDVNGNAWYRWFDPVANNIVVTALPARSHSIRTALDDVRRAATLAGVTDNVIAYVRFNTVYYRLLRERFLTERTVSAGYPLLFQIGMNNLFRFQFARSPVIAEQDPEITFKRPANRASKVTGFDDFGAGALYTLPATTRDGDAGTSNSVDKLITNGKTVFLRDDDGTLTNSTVDIELDFYLDDVDLRATRTFRFAIDGEGNITRTPLVLAGEASVQLVEVGAGTRTYTLTAYLDAGRGITLHLVYVTGAPTTGNFLPDWNPSSDFYGGGIVPTGRIRYVDYGTHVALSATGDGTYTARSTSTRMRWGAGSLPEPLRPQSSRTVPCYVSNDGVVVAGLAQFEADGSAEFWPLNVASTRLVKGTFVQSTDQVFEKGLAANWQLVYASAGPSSFTRIPTLASIAPPSVSRYATGVSITLTGTFFEPTSVARLNAVNLSTSYTSSVSLTATIPDAANTTAGVKSVDVFTPTPGGGYSATVTYTVNNPAPTLTTLTPATISITDTPIDITLTGSNFVPESVAYLDATPLTTVYVNSTELTATIPLSLSAATPDITVVNASPGGGTSGAQTLTITADLLLQFTDGYTPPAGDTIVLDFTNP